MVAMKKEPKQMTKGAPVSDPLAAAKSTLSISFQNAAENAIIRDYLGRKHEAQNSREQATSYYAALVKLGAFQ